MSKFQHDLTQGSVTKQLLLFSLPFLASNLLQALYNLADMLIVGRFCGPVGASAVGLGGQVTILVINLISGLAVGGTIMGANFDPSHLFWQGIDPVAAIRYLGDAIHFFHAKDTKIDAINTGANGVLDTKHYADEIHRAWIFRSVGYGHDYQLWKDIVSNLRMVGYDDVMSIEHEDSLMTPMEGLEKAITFLQQVMTFESKGEMWWA